MEQATLKENHSAHCFDVCVIGSGASGAIVASTLVRAGWDVVLVEQGSRVAPGTYLLDIIGGFEWAYARNQHGQWSLNGYPWTACVLGGGTMFYAGASFRYRLVDFDAREFVASDALDVRWPVNYEGLRESYDLVEQRLGVARSSGIDPTEPPSGHAPLPPHPMSRRGRLIAEAATRLGLQPFPTPLAIHSMPYLGHPGCQKLTCCTDNACPIGAKSDVVSRFIDPLTAKPNFTLRIQHKAVRLDQHTPFRVDSLECIDLQTRTRTVIKARLFVLAANAIQTAALLLRSTNHWWPTGVGNAEDWIGRGLCFKVSEYLSGWIDDVPPSPEDDKLERNLRGLYSTVSITDYYKDPECPSGLGGLIYEANPSLSFPDRSGVLLRLECLLADQPVFRNRVRLARRTDEYGLPRIIIDYRTHPLDSLRLEHLVRRTKRIMREAGVREVTREPSEYMLGSAHLHGTCRAGEDPKESVVDRYGRLHTIDNIYVVDGAFMPFPGGVNPTLTIQANAMRIAQYLAASERMVW